MSVRPGRLVLWFLLLTPVALAGYFAVRHLTSLSEPGAERAQRPAGSPAEIHIEQARAARRRGAFREAQQHLAAAEELLGQTPAVEREGLLLRAQQGNLGPEIEATLMTLARQDATQAAFVLEALTQGYLVCYRLGEARQTVQELLRRQPEHVPALVWSGLIAEGMQQFDQAEKDYRRAVELAPDHFEARWRLAEVLLSRRRVPEATREFERLRRQKPADAAVRLGLARCRRLAGQGARARRLLAGLVQERPNDAGALREMAKTALDEHHPAQAERWLRRAQAADPYDPETCHTLALCLRQLGKNKEAEHFRDRARRVEADLKRLWELNQQIARRPQDPDLRYQAGVICLRNGQPQEAIRWFHGALQINPDHGPTHQALADHYERLGKKDQASHHRQLVLKANGRTR